MTRIVVKNEHALLVELRRSAELTAAPLASQDVTADLADLADEVFVRGVLEEQLPAENEEVEVRIQPVWSEPPFVKQIEIELRARTNGSVHTFGRTFNTGRWVRTAQRQLLALHQEGTVQENESLHRVLLALPTRGAAQFPLANLEPPTIVEGTLEQFGVRRLGEGALVPDRPILLNHRVAKDSVEACLAAGTVETGKATLGLHVRLPECLPNTTTRIVTLLTACLDDQRHVGEVNEWKISPAALADAAKIAELRGLGERVLTVIHTHGWSAQCGNCNDNPACPLAECTHVSLKDYQVLETLFPSKATLMPIAGRKLGVKERRPVLEVHAWRGGEVRPVRWQEYHD